MSSDAAEDFVVDVLCTDPRWIMQRRRRVVVRALSLEHASSIVKADRLARHERVVQVAEKGYQR